MIETLVATVEPSGVGCTPGGGIRGGNLPQPPPPPRPPRIRSWPRPVLAQRLFYRGHRGRRDGRATHRIHFLEPRSTAFHADVEFGSTWNVEPARCGPTISQR
jgi:hypothetical protein